MAVQQQKLNSEMSPMMSGHNPHRCEQRPVTEIVALLASDQTVHVLSRSPASPYARGRAVKMAIALFLTARLVAELKRV
jgi:hypothetical protein